MGSSTDFPEPRGDSSTTASVAELITTLPLPRVEPLEQCLHALHELPPRPVPRETGPASYSQLDGVRSLMDQCLHAVAALHRHQNQCAALLFTLVDRLESTTLLEGHLLSLDPWQRTRSLDQVRAELAVTLHITEGAAGRLMGHASTLVRELPESLAAMESGDLGWDYAVVIAEETELLRATGLPTETVTAFEQALLNKAVGSTLRSFREKARRLRERSYPETIPARTRRAYTDRRLGITHSTDGMSWLSLYAPSPAIEAIWDQCTLTATAAQGPHETRTLTQLRADVAAALLLNQTMAENHIYRPAPETNIDDNNCSTGTIFTSPGNDTGAGTGGGGAAGEGGAGSGGVGTGAGATTADPWFRPREPDPCRGGPFPDPSRGVFTLEGDLIPDFDDPDYASLGFREPDIRNTPYWHPELDVIHLDPAPGEAPPGTGPDTSHSTPYPPLPQALPVVLIPVFSLLGLTNEPAWMEGAGPISMDIARRMSESAPSIYRLLVDPISNKPLEAGMDCYRITKTMRTMLRIRDEYCQFPGCNAKASTSEIDHIQAFNAGGKTTAANLEHLCKRHHHMKHFKDDKNHDGQYRSINEPERHSLRLRGWTPRRESDGRIGWTTPTGQYCPPEPGLEQPPAYPKWIKTAMDAKLAQKLAEQSEHDWEKELLDTPEDDGSWGPAGMPEPPPGLFPTNAEEEEVLNLNAIQHALENPSLGQSNPA
ncbi:HNH endonuclease signature motif containing protein [Arthrobacter alpinus]|uniref:HNH endonuclease signature motif containing protein n=1 Tax=Arthrobacter alpinus TaxID=656366 RepID=UPI0009F92F9A|nr:HNH endonuclease signature motif containing protein [Arthrobacter alpinus]